MKILKKFLNIIETSYLSIQKKGETKKYFQKHSIWNDF